MDFLTSLFQNNSLAAIGITGYLVVILKDIPALVWNNIRQYISFSLSVDSKNTRYYRFVTKWLLSLKSKSLLHHVALDKDSQESKESNWQYSLNVGNYFVYKLPFTFIFISKEKLDKQGIEYQTLLNVYIYGLKRKFIQDFYTSLNSETEGDKLIVKSSDSNSVLRISKRSFDSIFIDHQKKKDIIDFLDFWKNPNTPELYQKYGLRFKTGIAFYGETGTGKSSLASAIASYLGYSIYSLNLHGMNSDSDFLWRIGEVEKNSVILLEDFDCVGVTENRETPKGNKMQSSPVMMHYGRGEGEMVSLSCFLNVLDGLNTPENVVFIATTNHIDKIDPAILRSGRFDLKVELNNLQEQAAVEMCGYYGQNKDFLKEEKFPINPAYLQNKLLQKTIQDSLTITKDGTTL